MMTMIIRRALCMTVVAAMLLALLALPGRQLARAAPSAPRGEAECLRYTFDTGLDGWTTGDAGGEYDLARWSDGNGNPPGSAVLDGSDLGSPDGQPNAWVYKTIALPADVEQVSFDTRATMDGALRLRLVDEEDDSHVLLDWEVLAGSAWLQRSADLTPFAGQTVTLYFEQGDNDLGKGEHRYVDNVLITPSGCPEPLHLYLPLLLGGAN